MHLEVKRWHRLEAGLCEARTICFFTVSFIDSIGRAGIPAEKDNRTNWSGNSVLEATQCVGDYECM